MSETIKIAVDAMGGDYAPAEPVKGAVRAAADCPNAEIILLGPEDVLKAELAKYTYPKERIVIKHASEVITPDEHPVAALRAKKDSTIVVGCGMVKNGEAEVFLSAGSTGALVSGGTLLVGRLKGVERPPIAFELPTQKGTTLCLDCGSTVDPKPSMLVQFARMGSLYVKNMHGIENPTVGILNIGAEEEKGNALTKETYQLLKQCDDINFIGAVEPRDIPLDGADVVVCDAFTGNTVLKLYEGLGSLMIKTLKKSMLSSIKTKIGAMFLKSSIKKELARFDTTQYGGAPLLGLKGLVLKTHGNSNDQCFYNTIVQGYEFSKHGVNAQIGACFEALNKKKTPSAEAAE